MIHLQQNNLTSKNYYIPNLQIRNIQTHNKNDFLKICMIAYLEIDNGLY